MLIQLTDAQYESTVAAAGVAPEEVAHQGRELRRVHRLLVIERHTKEDLIPREQDLADLMADWQLTKISGPSGLDLEAVEVDPSGIVERPTQNTPRAEVGRRVRAQMIESRPEIASWFYHQLQREFSLEWGRTKEQVRAERGDAADVAVETAAAARYAARQAERLANHDTARATWESRLIAGELRMAPDEVEEARYRYAKSRAKIVRTWEQLDDVERMTYRNDAEEEWFLRGVFERRRASSFEVLNL